MLGERAVQHAVVKFGAVYAIAPETVLQIVPKRRGVLEVQAGTREHTCAVAGITIG